MGSIVKLWGLSHPGWTPHCWREALGSATAAASRLAGDPSVYRVPSSPHTHWVSLSLLQGLVLEPLLLLFPTFLFPRPTGLGPVILGKSLVIPGFLRGAGGGVVPHPKQISLECLRGVHRFWRAQESPEMVPQIVHVCAYMHCPGERIHGCPRFIQRSLTPRGSGLFWIGAPPP